jgi:hypothetical protein
MPSIPRNGKPTTLTFELEALEILHRLAPGRKAQGFLLSMLLRQEEQRRIESRHLREKLITAVEEVLAAP